MNTQSREPLIGDHMSGVLGHHKKNAVLVSQWNVLMRVKLALRTWPTYSGKDFL